MSFGSDVYELDCDVDAGLVGLVGALQTGDHPPQYNIYPP